VAFESFRQQERARPRRQRRLAFALVALFHGVLIAAGIVYSFWHVEELTPPTLRVTFMSAAPPPPPPPPPPAGGGGARAKKVAVKAKPIEPVPTKPPEIVQPPEKPRPIKKEFRKHEDEYVEEDDAKPATGTGVGKGAIEGDGDDDGEEGGVAGGVKGGQKGGVIGGTIGGSGPPAAPRMMPPQFGATMKVSGPDPCFPPALNHGGMGYVVGATICISTTGSVENVTVTKPSDPRLNDCVTNAVRAWRFRPMHSGGLTAPFCYPAKFEFNSHQ
jgi:protein TonB